KELELGDVGILVLVYQDESVTIVEAREHVLACSEEAREFADEVVEVERAKRSERGLVARVDLFRDEVVLVFFVDHVVGWLDEGVLGERDAREDRGRVHSAIGDAAAPQALLHDAERVALIEDGERAADRSALLAERDEAERVERRDREIFVR